MGEKVSILPRMAIGSVPSVPQVVRFEIEFLCDLEPSEVLARILRGEPGLDIRREQEAASQQDELVGAWAERLVEGDQEGLRMIGVDRGGHLCEGAAGGSQTRIRLDPENLDVVTQKEGIQRAVKGDSQGLGQAAEGGPIGGLRRDDVVCSNTGEARKFEVALPRVERGAQVGEGIAPGIRIHPAAPGVGVQEETGLQVLACDDGTNPVIATSSEPHFWPPFLELLKRIR